MKKFLAKFKNINEPNLNLKLIKRDYEEDLVEFIVEVFKSLETIPYISFLSYSVEYDESKIPFHRYITSRRKKKKRDKNVKYHYIKSDRACELTMRFLITLKSQTKIIKKSILIPTFDKNNYLTLKGNKYFLLYQLVDSSTYVSKNGLTLKSLMPIIVQYREKVTKIKDINGVEYQMITYFMKVFKRDISLMLFFFCRMGFHNGIKYYLMDRIIRIVEPSAEIDMEKWIRFPINKNLHMIVWRHFFDKYDCVRALTAMIYECFGSKTTVANLDSKVYWMEQLGSLYTTTKHKRIESGRSTMLFFERLLDLTTKKKLKVSEINKISIYAIVKWLTLDFIELRQKNNMDLNTKRLRLKEYIASMLNLKLGNSINRVLTYGNKVSMRQIETNLFKFPNTIVMSILSSSSLIKYDDRVNDCDFFSALRYTVKGPNSLGSGKSERNIGVRYRGVNPSYIGSIDINVYSSSSPGLNGSLTPFAHTTGLYFNDDPEPQNKEFEIYQDLRKESEAEGNVCASIGIENDPLSYYKTRMDITENAYNNFRVEVQRDPEMVYIKVADDDSNTII